MIENINDRSEILEIDILSHHFLFYKENFDSK